MNHLKLEEFIAEDPNFFVKLRSLEGLDRESVRQFMLILDDIGIRIKDAMFIGKRLAYLLVELLPIPTACETLFQGERQEIASEIG